MVDVSSWPVIQFKEDFDANKVTFTKMVSENKDGTPKKMNAFYINYDEAPFLIRSPLITLEYGGILSEDNEYVETEQDRQFINIPLDANNDIEVTRESEEVNVKRCKELAVFKKIIDFFQNSYQDDNVKNTIFGDGSKYGAPYDIKERDIKGTTKSQMKLSFKYNL